MKPCDTPANRPDTAPRPSKTTVRSYQVGFGDCFLLSVHYDDNPDIGTRHILIDCGSTAMPKYKPVRSLRDVADNIRSVTGGKLHGVVATHRHKDHIGGFAGAAGDIIMALQPEVVVQPWTEDPTAQVDARAPVPASRKGLHAATLMNMQKVADCALQEVRSRKGAIASGVRDQIEFIGDDNLSNKDAVENLAAMANGNNHYVHYGMTSGLEEVLPGVTIHVLGPPSLEQSDQILSQRSRDADEFWHFQAAAGRSAASQKRLFPKADICSTRQKGRLPIETRWFLPRLDRIRGEQLLQIVRSLDHAMNNTSLILLFEVGRRKFLFAGDAQIENWEYCLKTASDRQSVLRLLEDVDFYKVGHHGSLNATPKTLWNLFRKRNKTDSPERMSTVVSTMGGKHGSDSRGTEVPRRKLTDALKEETDYLTTQTLRGEDAFFHQQEFDAWV